MHAPLIAVPQHGTLLDVLAERYRAAFDKVKGGRAQWIEGTLELAAVLLEAKREMPDTTRFSIWVEQHQLQEISHQDRAALIWLGSDLGRARMILGGTDRTSWQHIVAKEKRRRVTQASKSQPTPNRARSKRNRVPTAMQDEAAPQPKPAKHLPPPEPGKRVSDYALTPEQVDPDFKGTHLEFKTKYGHVTLQPKQKIEHNKRQEALSSWLGAVSEHERTARVMFTAMAAVDSATLQEWMSKPAKLAKFQMWRKSIKVACDELLKC